MTMTLKELADRLHGEPVGDPNLIIERVRPFEAAGPGSVTLAVGRHREDLTASDASVFIVPAEGVTDAERERFALILSRSPKMAFAQAIALFHVPAYRAGGVSPDLVVGAETVIGADATIAPRVTIGRNCRIGDRVTLHAGTVIGDDVTIGDDCVFFPNVTVYDRVRIGHRVVLHAGTVVGSDGFGYAQDEAGRHVKIPQIGDVAIEDDVETGANCCIDRATFGTTRIGRGTKLDNLVHIAHNCEVGEYTVMAAQVGISGSVKIGRHVTIAGQVGTNPHVTIGDGALVVGKTGVSKHVAPGSQVAGMPTQTLKDWKLTHIYASQLPTRLPKLEARVAALEEDVKKHRSDE